MKKLARWLLNAVTILSLVLCVATVGLWVRSYCRDDRWVSRDIGGQVTYRQWGAESVEGIAVLFQQHVYVGDRPGFESRPVRTPARPFDVIGWPPVHVGGNFWSPSNWNRFIVFRYSYAFVTFAVAPSLIAIGRLRARRRRMRLGTCHACSYDLTGNVSGVCPECGAAIAKGNP